MEIAPQDRDALIREKYQGDVNAPGVAEDLERLQKGEPLAYVIGNIPFLGITLDLGSRPLIPRPETEWWTESIINELKKNTNKETDTIYDTSFNPVIRILDLCAGSGAIGLAVLKHVKDVQVSFGEVVAVHTEAIRKNIEANNLDASRTEIKTGDLFVPFKGETFNIIATNPPYISTDRTLDEGVTAYEPGEALFAGKDGMAIIRRICEEARTYLADKGELWMECDIDNIRAARELLESKGFKDAQIRTDQYGRERLIVAHL